MSSGISWPALNQTVCALRFFYGVTPGHGEIPERIGKVSLCGDEMMRTLLYEGAQSVLTRSTQLSWLKVWTLPNRKARAAIEQQRTDRLIGGSDDRLGSLSTEQIATQCQLRCPVAVGEKAVMADAVKAIRQGVEQKAAINSSAPRYFCRPQSSSPIAISRPTSAHASAGALARHGHNPHSHARTPRLRSIRLQ
jgi:hypothetical protein